MIDSDLIRQKLVLIETCVHELKTLGHPEDIRTDVRELRFQAYTLTSTTFLPSSSRSRPSWNRRDAPLIRHPRAKSS